MGKITINNGNWDEAENENNTKHRGEGVATENNRREILMRIKELIEQYLLEKYLCQKEQLANESKREEPDSPSGADSVGSPFGPGRIGTGGPGHAGKTNLFVGLPEPDAVALADAIQAIKDEELREYVERVVNNNC